MSSYGVVSQKGMTFKERRGIEIGELPDLTLTKYSLVQRVSYNSIFTSCYTCLFIIS